jgi:hypothetical protein
MLHKDYDHKVSVETNKKSGEDLKGLGIKNRKPPVIK